MVGNPQHTNQECAEDSNDQEKPNEAESFTHDGKDGIVDRLWEITSCLNGVANTDAEKAARANGKHGVLDMIS